MTDIEFVQKQIYRLKKTSSERWAESYGFNGVFLGLRKEESQGRQMSLTIRSPIYQMKSGFWKCCPLANWTGKDVWAYIISKDLVYPEFYNFTALGDSREWIRSASWVTTDGANKGRLVWLKYYYPQYYRQLLREFPEVGRYA